MCGIFGASSVQDFKQEESCVSALKSFSYRGPDNTGFSVEDAVFLGNNRLSIIDVNERANQPIVDSQKNSRIVFNGEIYNYKQLKKELEADNQIFLTNSDTEVILVGYNLYGPSFFGRLQGMFAIAIHDLHKHKIILARDHAGIKPLLYFKNNDSIVFSSEMKGVAQYVNPSNLSIDQTAVKLLSGYGSVPSPLTLFNEVKKLEKGCWVEFDLIGKKLSKAKRIEFKSDNKITLEEKIERSIERHLVSDVPIGVFFSGGIDSSLIASYLAKKGHNLKTYSLRMVNKPDDEKYAKLIANHLKIEPEYIDFGIEEFTSSYAEIRDKIDEPTLDSSMVALYHMAKIARKETKVVLSGEGGDEMFYGYARQGEIIKMKHAKNESSLLDKLFQFLPNFKGKRTIFARLFVILGYTKSYYLSQLSPGVSVNGWQEWRNFIAKNDINPNYYDKEIYLENDLLRKMDFGTSYASIEGRVPFLDVSLYVDEERPFDDFKSKLIPKRILKSMLSMSLSK